MIPDPQQPSEQPTPQQPAAAYPPPPPAAYAPPPPGYGPAPSNDDKGMGVLIWVLGIFFPLLGPLIIWLIKKDESPFIDQVGKTALNFHISYTIWVFVSALLILLIIGIVLLPVVAVMSLVFSIVGATKANDGDATYVPFGTITFIR